MSWPNTYRPHQFQDLHLTKVKQIFLSFLKQGYFPQVLLFTGPKGTGKTTAARLLAATLNTPANQPAVKTAYLSKKRQKPQKTTAFVEPDLSDAVVDSILRGQSYCVQELDAASNRGIDDIRLLKDRVQLPPTSGVMTVYILDEAHMLTTQAFNALLKLLEEPPAHAVFVLATTEADKVPDTIKSRCQIIQFEKASSDEIHQAMAKVIAQEKVEINPDALDLICSYADGSFRDGLKYLELCAQSSQKITLSGVESVISPMFLAQAQTLISTLIQKDTAGLLNTIHTLRQQGVEDKKFVTQLVKLLHTTLVEIQTELPQTLALTEKACRFLLTAFLDPDLTLASPVPLLRLELLCLDLIDRANNKSGASAQAEPRSIAEPKLKSDKNPVSLESTPTKPNPTQSSPNLNHPSASKLLEKWEEFLYELSQRNSSLAAFMRSSKPILQDDQVLQLHVYYKFHQQQLSLPKFKQLASEAAAALDLALPELAILLSAPPTQPDTAATDVLAERPLTEIASKLLS